MSFQILDVGCGPNPKGSVNCDMFKDFTPEWNLDRKVRVCGDNLVCCIGEYLPFKDNAFELVWSSHVIEHCTRPSLFLKELIRVSNSKVIVKCPSRFGRMAKMRYHRSFLNCSWFNNQLKGLQTSVTFSRHWSFLFVLKFPEEITVKIWKRKNDIEYLFS